MSDLNLNWGAISSLRSLEFDSWLTTFNLCKCHGIQENFISVQPMVERFKNIHNRCIRELATEVLGKFLVMSTRTLGRGEETLLSSGWTLTGSVLSSPNFNSSVRAERSVMVRYLNVVIKLLCGNLNICLTTRLTPTFGRRSRPEVKDAFFGSRFSVALLRNLADFPST